MLLSYISHVYLLSYQISNVYLLLYHVSHVYLLSCEINHIYLLSYDISYVLKHVFNEAPIVTFKKENNLDDIYWLLAYSFTQRNTYVRDVAKQMCKV
jgi:hypothetical protein